MRNSPNLLDQVRRRIRALRYSIRTEESYVNRIRQYILFHNKRHSNLMGKAEMEQFLTCLAVERKVSSATQNQALSALAFLYKRVPDMKIALGGERGTCQEPQAYSDGFDTKRNTSTFCMC